MIYQKFSFSTRKDLEFDVKFWIVSVWLENENFQYQLALVYHFEIIMIIHIEREVSL